MMPPIVVAYPADSTNSALVHSAWQQEAQFVMQQGIATTRIDARTFQIAANASIVEGAQILWRGPVLSASAYTAFEAQLRTQGHRLFTPTQDYLRAQHLPAWIPLFTDHCTETRVVPASHLAQIEKVLAKLNWWPLSIRDYAQTLSAEPATNTEAVHQQIGDKSTLEGGLCLQKAEPINANTQCRFFVWQQNVWPHPQADEAATAMAKLVARRFWQPFYTVDLAQRSDGRWRVMSINDGQIAQLNEWPAERFAEFLRPSLQPHLP